MEFIDLTHKMTNKMSVFPGDPNFELSLFKKSTEKDPSTVSKICGSLHTGTHLDSSYHYIKNGEKISDLKLNTLIGKSSILEYNNSEKEIYFKNIENELEKIIILKTSWCDNWDSDEYYMQNPYLSKEFAKTLIEKNVQGIAIDTPSVDMYGKNQIHKLLLKNNIWIVENLTNTNKLIKKEYDAFFIPMNISSEASYVRSFVKK